MKIYILFFLLTLCSFVGYYAFIAWRDPEKLQSHIFRYARLFNWNPNQAEWIRSTTYFQIARVSYVIAFILVMAVTLWVIFQ